MSASDWVRVSASGIICGRPETCPFWLAETTEHVHEVFGVKMEVDPSIEVFKLDLEAIPTAPDRLAGGPETGSQSLKPYRLVMDHATGVWSVCSLPEGGSTAAGPDSRTQARLHLLQVTSTRRVGSDDERLVLVETVRPHDEDDSEPGFVAELVDLFAHGEVIRCVQERGNGLTIAHSGRVRARSGGPESDAMNGGSALRCWTTRPDGPGAYDGPSTMEGFVRREMIEAWRERYERGLNERGADMDGVGRHE